LILQKGKFKTTTKKIHPRIQSNVFFVSHPASSDIVVQWPMNSNALYISYGRFQKIEVPIQSHSIRSRRKQIIYYSLTASAVWNAFIGFVSTNPNEKE
jgi:hypothetical protein